MITCVVNTMTCLVAGVFTFAILGNLATTTGQDISNVVSSGPGLIFKNVPRSGFKITRRSSMGHPFLYHVGSKLLVVSGSFNFLH